MGAVCASEEVRVQASTNRLIEKVIDKERRNETGNQKLLLLGAGECGKSTILKQMQILHKNGFTEAEYEEKTEIVYSNTVTSMAAILRAMGAMNLSLDSDREIDAKQVLNTVDAGKDSQPFTPDLSQALK
uniref:G-protein alpha subunit n=1 Tax=Plectus sambesii TaxID=2011161 RepID=A0A914UNT9_9BILA